jgi:DNA-binding CsgD family transcriptional regulator
MAEFKYDRIPPGKYTFMLKAVNADGTISKTINWSFQVSPPWYLTILAQFIYLILIVAFMLYIRFYLKKRLKVQARRMKIEKERELIKLRNEKLETEITHKSKELANTTFSIIKKNEMLFEIRRKLMQQKKQTSSGVLPKYSDIVKLIDRNITSEDDWKIFESNFEQAHEEFLKRIKEKIPDLTPSDLKLSAYLRMNLSSKKIALLLGITIRGVENHRYRLRKKIGLEHDSNLIDFLMKF